MKEVVFDYHEFVDKVDHDKPIHHCAYTKCIDKQHGIFYRITFQLSGISKKDGHIVMWIAERRTTISDRDRMQDKVWYNELVEKYAKPINSTEGEWR